MIELSDIAPSFSFLLEEGFVKGPFYYKPDEFGNAEIIMYGPKFSFKFERDRGQVFIDIGENGLGWEKLEYALIFVDSTIEEKELGAPPDIDILSVLTKDNLEKITEIYEVDNIYLEFIAFCQKRAGSLLSSIFSKS